ncbi:MAG: WD40 repeat domain-containing protein, partial [Planctomycetaceae bacterium]|nr:WD40 repeat domain-containing protein [Planctomycetaceae bacterium]
CGVSFELKRQNQVDSVHIDHIEEELNRLRTEIEYGIPRQREKSVIGPLPLQTLKKNLKRPGMTSDENREKTPDYYSMIGRVRSALVHLENEQLADYLEWRESRIRHASHDVEPHDSTGPNQHPAPPVSDSCQGTQAAFSDRLHCRKTKFRRKCAVAGIILGILFGVAFFVVEYTRSGNRSLVASRNTTEKETILEPTHIIEVSQSARAPSMMQDSTAASSAIPVVPPNVPGIIPGFVRAESTLEIPIPNVPVVSEDNRNQEIQAVYQQQLAETQTQLTELARQIEQTRYNNEQLERAAKQNEAESFLWEAYAHTEKNPVRSMILSLQSIERFKELELDVPAQARWALNQSLSFLNLGLSFNGFQGGVDAMTLSRDGQWFLVSGNDGKVWLWDISKHDQVSGSFCLDTVNGGVTQLELLITGNARYGFCVGRNGSIRLWNLAIDYPSEKPINIIDARCHFTRVVVSEDGHWLAAYGEPGRNNNHPSANNVWLWDLNQLARNGMLPPPIELKGHEKPIRSLAISNNSKWIVSGSEDRTVRVYDLKAAYPAAEQIVLKDNELAVHCVAVSPDGRWLVTGGHDSILRMWDLQNRSGRAEPIPFQEHEGWITTLAFSADGRWLASGSYDTTIRIWRMSGQGRPEVVRVLTDHDGPVTSVEFSPQGNQLISQGLNRDVKLWNLDQGNPSENVLTFSGVQVPISSAMLTGDGKWLILAQQKPSVPGVSGLRLWPLVFDEAFECAADFAEARFPAMYQRVRNSGVATLEIPEERIALAESRP